MLLQYELGVVGASFVSRVLAGVERRFVQHVNTINRTLGVKGSRSSSSESVVSAARRNAAGISRVQITEAERAARKVAAAEEKAARQTEQYWARAHRRSVDQRIRDSERAAKAEARAAEKTIRARQR